MSNNKSNSIVAFKYLLPLLILIIAIRVVPSLYTVYSSFFDWRLTRKGMDFIFLDTYKEILTDANFWKVLWTTVIWTVVSTVFHITLGMALSISLNKVK